MKTIELEILFIRVVFCLISLIGCVWHVSDISTIYFSYQTTVNVQFEREVMVEMPAITLCTNISYATDYQYMRHRYENELKNITDISGNEWIFGEYLRNLTLDEQLLNATISSQQVFNSCDVIKPLAFEDRYAVDYIGCENISKIRESVDYNKKCFTLFSQLNDEYNDNYIIDHDINVRDNAFPLYKIILNNKYLNDLVLFVHSRGQPYVGFIGGQTNGIHLNNTKYISFTLSYTKTTAQLLPEPYETNCLNYTTIGYRSQSHCIINCKANYFVEHFDGWHNQIPYSAQYTGRQIWYELNNWRENRTADKLMANYCKNICSSKQNCLNEYFSITTIGQFERERGVNERVHGIFIYLPSGLNTRYIHSPRLLLIEYICYIASVFSLWFGISITTLSKIFIVLYNYKKNKKHMKTVHKIRDTNIELI